MHIDFLECVDSTRNVVRDWFFSHTSHKAMQQQIISQHAISNFAPLNYTAVAYCQTNGTGRRGTAWITPKDSSLMLSTLIKIPLELQNTPHLLNFIAGISALELVQKSSYTETPQNKTNIFIKWPNDIIYRDKNDEKFRKVAGIISELIDANHACISIGLNIFQTENDFNFDTKMTPGSLALLCPPIKELDKRDFIKTLAKDFMELLVANVQKFTNSSAQFSGKMLYNVVKQNILLNHEITVHTPDSTQITGTAIDLNQDFCLKVIETDTERIVDISVGDVAIL